MVDYTATEMMTVTAARALGDGDVCFVGIGPPSVACNLARLNHAPDITLIYESGTIGARPQVLPLSIGDGELCETALTTVSVPEIFRYWLQGGRISVGFLSAAQVDKYGNINTTVIGDYNNPKVRLPGGGGAPEIASCCNEVFIVLRHSKRTFVEKLDFVTSLGRGNGGDSRRRAGATTKGPTRLVTDLCVMTPDDDGEFVVSALYPGISREQVVDNTGWTVRFADDVQEMSPPTKTELALLRDLNERTARAHRTS